MARSTAYDAHPQHTVEIAPCPGRVRVEWAGETVADSRRALRVREASYPPVVYVPREDVRMDLLERSDQHSYCPFKGHASYYTLRAGDRVSENAVWSYEDPYDQVAVLKDCAAFYPDRIDALREDAS